MLSVQTISSGSDRWKFIDELDSQTMTYIVADLGTKTKVQDYQLQKITCLPEFAVLRVHEFWSLLLKQTDPSLRQVNPVLIRSLLGDWLKQNQDRVSSFPGTADLLTKYIGVFLPFLIQDERKILLLEWLNKNPDSFLRWGSWFYLANEAYDILKAKKMSSRLWVGGILLGLSEPLNWKHNLIFDIGAELSSIEVELIQMLSEKQNVTVLCPDDAAAHKYAECFKAYEKIGAQKAKTNSGAAGQASEAAACHFECRRFPTQLAEIKDCVSWVRQCLDVGVQPEDISVLAADIEGYWPILEAHLQIEGVPVSKSTICHLQSLPEIMDWLSALRLYAKDISTGDLETNLFVRRKKSPISYDEFQRLYTFIYDESDLGRKKVVADLFQYKFQKEDFIARDEMIIWSLNFWPSFERKGLERVVAQILLECPRDTQLRLQDWLGYLSELCAKGELTIEPGNSKGIVVSNLDSALHSTANYIYLLGLSKEALRPEVDLAISTRDILRIEQDLGIPMNDPVTSQFEYSVHFLYTQNVKKSVFSFAETDLTGEPLSPSLFWVERRLPKNLELEKLDQAQVTRFDEIQENCHSRVQDSEIGQSLLQDLGAIPLPKMPFIVDRAWSISQIETLYNCPFQFAAARLMRLSDTPFADMDMDRMTNGQFVHELLYHILKAPEGLSWSAQMLEEKVDMLRENYIATGLGGSQSAWILKKKELLMLANRFIDFEKNFRKLYPKLKSKYLEQSFEVTIPVKDKNVQFKGRMDRIDTDEADHLILYDYKSAGQFTNGPSWVKNDQLQLLFYAYVLDQKLVPSVEGAVAGAFYYVLSTMNRAKGYKTEDSSHLIPDDYGGKKVLTHDDVLNMYQETMSKISYAIERVEAGELSPSPKKEELCKTCKWNGLCRAKHLI